MLSACASTNPASSPQQRDALIAQLEAAKQTDQRNALAPGINPITQGDFMHSATKVDAVVAAVRQGQYVSDRDLRLALTVPPKSMSAQQRQDYINQLQAARDLDRHGVQDYTWDSPGKVQDYAVQIKMIDEAIALLRTDQPVSWWQIQQALHVPPNP